MITLSSPQLVDKCTYGSIAPVYKEFPDSNIVNIEIIHPNLIVFFAFFLFVFTQWSLFPTNGFLSVTSSFSKKGPVEIEY